MTVLVSPRGTTGAVTWQVDTLTRPRGTALVEQAGEALRVQVGDELVPSAGKADSGGTDASVARREATEVVLHPDGRAVVRVHASPPVLLVTPSGSRLLPAAPAAEDEVVLECGDVLVLCSAEALGHLPTGLGGVLRHSPLRLGQHDPEGLLEELMTGSDVGAAAVAVCLPARPSGTERAALVPPLPVTVDAAS